MKVNDRDKSILEHIAQHCIRVNEDIERYGNTYESFCSDSTFKDSVSMNILQIGELTGRLSNDFKTNTQSQIPWKEVRSMRNLFAHDYSNMSTKKIWETASIDVPVLLLFCEKQVELFDKEQSVIGLSQAEPPKEPQNAEKQEQKLLDEQLSSKETPPAQTQSQEQNEK